MDDLLLLGEIKALPKIELHRHLEGSIRLTTMVEIAEQFGIEMPEYEIETLRPFVQVMPGEYRSDKTFLGKFKTIRQFFLSTEIIARMAREAVEDAANDNIKYMELRFTPKALCNICKCTPHDIVTLMCETVAAASAEFGIQTRLIVSINRHEGFDIAEQALQAALAHRNLGVVGFDMGGDEAAYPASLFLDLFRRAKAEGMRITLHAGEWEGAQSVWDAVGNLGAERIGHGIKALEDPGVIAVLVGRGIVLEVCPSSNVDSGIVSELAVHPLPELIKSGVKVTLNTDDPLISNITLSDEIFRAVQYMGLTLDDVKQHIMIAANAAFLNGEEHVALVKQFHTWLYASESTLKDS